MDKRKPIRKHSDDNPEQSHPFLYEQLCKLCVSLGKPKHNVKQSIKYLLRKHSFDNDKRFELVVLNNLRLRFEEMQRFGDSRNNDLNELRANLCMHLYRELVRVESDEDKRYQYLKLFYELLDAGEPDNMTEEETLNYRLVVIDRLNNQVNNLLMRLENMEVSQDNSVESLSSFSGPRPVQSELNVEAYAKKEFVLHKYCELKGFTYQHESLVSTNLNNYKYNSIEMATKNFISESEDQLASFDSTVNQNSKMYLNSKLEHHNSIDLKELSMIFLSNSNKFTEIAEENSLSRTQDKLNILNNFESRIPRLQQLEPSSSSSSNTFLSKEFGKYKVRRGILNLCQSENFFKPMPIQSEMTIMGYSTKEHILSKQVNIKCFRYQFGFSVYVDLKNDQDQENFMKDVKNSPPVAQSLILVEEFFVKDHKFYCQVQVKPIQIVVESEYYVALEHNSSKISTMKGLLCHLESLMCANAQLVNHKRQKNEHESLYNDFKILKQILTSKIYDFSKEPDGNHIMADIKLTQQKTDEHSSIYSSKSYVENDKHRVIDNIGNRFSNKFNPAVVEQELENYKGLLVKLQESHENLGKSIQTSLSKTQFAPKKIDSLDNLFDISLDLTKSVHSEMLDNPLSSPFINVKEKVVQMEKSKFLSYAEKAEEGFSINLKNEEISGSLLANNIKFNNAFDKQNDSGDHPNIQKSHITYDPNPILYKANIVNHIIHPPCQIKGFKMNSGSLEWADVEEKKHEYIMAQFMEMDDVVADVQKALNQIIENNFRIKDDYQNLKITKIQDTGKNLISPKDSQNFGSNELSNPLESSTTSVSKSQLLDKSLENYKLLLDELEELRLDSNQNIKQIVTKYQTRKDQCQDNIKINPVNVESNTLDNCSSATVRSTCQYVPENSIIEEDNFKDSLKKSGFLNKWQHQRHVIAAPGIIIRLFKSNPAYQCNPIDANAPNLFEELEQFNEMMAQRDSPLKQLIDVSAVHRRLILTLDRVRNQLPEKITQNDYLNLVGKIQLKHLLTQKENGALEAMRWQFIDRNAVELSHDEQLRDAFNGMLGYECQQLKYSLTSSQLQLRYPEHQRNLSESYLLLVLGYLGCVYRSLQNQQAELKSFGKSGLTLAESQRMELLLYKEFHLKIQQCEKPTGLYHIWQMAKLYQTRFQWMVNLNKRIFKEGNLFLTLLKEQRGCNKKLLQKWLLLVSQPMLEKLSRWLRHGELADFENGEFFIMENLTVSTEKFWHERFSLLTEYIPIYFNKELCQSLLSAGKYHRYGKEFLGIDVKISLNYQEFIKAFQLTYQKCKCVPLHGLIMTLNQEISLNILSHHEPPIDVFYKVFKYVLLRDIHFVTQLIEYLEPVLEQSAKLYDLEQFNYMLEHILTEDNSKLYIEEVPSDGILCWSRFQLSWRWSHNWQALLGKSIDIYLSIFTDLWKFHYANYVLCERIFRQQKYFSLRIKLECFEDVNQVRELFQVLLDIFLDVMHILKDYLIVDVLDDAYGKLKQRCHEVKTLDDIIEAHRHFLNAITMDFFQTKKGNDCIFYLNQLYNYIFNLDAAHQKFVSECQSLMVFLRFSPNRDDISNRLLNFSRSCKDTWNTLNQLGDKFQLCLNELMLSLFNYGSKKSKSLAEKLDAKDLYEIDGETLQNV